MKNVSDILSREIRSVHLYSFLTYYLEQPISRMRKRIGEKD